MKKKKYNNMQKCVEALYAFLQNVVLKNIYMELLYV